VYTIEVTYQTGDSFNTETCTDTIGLVWEDKQLARKALQAIKENNTLYLEKESYGGRGRDDIYKDVLKCDWYKPEGEDESDPYWWNWVCKVEMDDVTFRNVPTRMWQGYFETLHEARVVCEQDDEDCITF
jgi:hypothetical protein